VKPSAGLPGRLPRPLEIDVSVQDLQLSGYGYMIVGGGMLVVWALWRAGERLNRILVPVQKGHLMRRHARRDWMAPFVQPLA
jgi:hypothetical protein